MAISTDDQTTSASVQPDSDEPTTVAAGADLKDPHVGRTIGNYRIKSVIASGGMGTVYLADDTKHGRQVACLLGWLDPFGADPSTQLTPERR